MTAMHDIPEGAVSATDLADLMASFNDVSSKLQATHETLRAEVKRLNTELREANEALQRSKRLAALGEMAAGISHEIRNPLGAIRLYATTLEEDLTHEPELCEVATKIGGAVTRLNEVVGDVLAFSRETRIRRQMIDPEALLASAIEACGPALPSMPSVEIEPGLAMTGDSGLLEQALVNVLRNAGEAAMLAGATEQGVACAVTQKIDAETERPHAVLSVRDRGPGLPPEVIERMFNPFFTTRAAGTGLGLAIVHRIVDAHGGRVDVRNNADERPGEPGATVELWIPMSNADEASPEPRRVGMDADAATRSMERTA